jgi:hypothetical protein
MKKMILFLSGIFLLSSCGSRVSCDSRSMRRTVLQIAKNRVTAKLAWQRLYDTELYTIDSYLGQQLAALAWMSGSQTKTTAQIKQEAFDDLLKLVKGQKLPPKKEKEYRPYVHYADSIISLGSVHLERIMVVSKKPELKKCTGEALLVFDPAIGLNNIDLLYVVQKDAKGEVYVTVYF